MPKYPPVHEQLSFLTVVTVQLHGGLLMVLLHWLSVKPAGNHLTSINIFKAKEM